MSKLLWKTAKDTKAMTLTFALKDAKTEEFVADFVADFSDWTLDEERTRYTLLNGFRAWFNEEAAKHAGASQAAKLQACEDFFARVAAGQFKAERASRVHVPIILIQAISAEKDLPLNVVEARSKSWTKEQVETLKEAYKAQLAELKTASKTEAEGDFDDLLPDAE